MTNDTRLHYVLKELGKDILYSKGFAKEEIIEEYSMKISDNQRYIIDVVGIRTTVDVIGNKIIQKIAIECNYTNKPSLEKLTALKREFNEVYELGINHLINYLEYKLSQALANPDKATEMKILNLEEQIKTKTEQINELQSKLQMYDGVKQKGYEVISASIPLELYAMIIDHQWRYNVMSLGKKKVAQSEIIKIALERYFASDANKFGLESLIV